MPLPILLSLLVAGQPAELRVLDAVYGNPERGRMCDATQPVAQQCDGRSACAIAVSNGMCGDPDYGMRKRLFLTFKCGPNPAQTAVITEGTVIRLTCGPLTPPAPPAHPGPGRPAPPAEGTTLRLAPPRPPPPALAVASAGEMVETTPVVPAGRKHLGVRDVADFAGGPAPPP